MNKLPIKGFLAFKEYESSREKNKYYFLYSYLKIKRRF